MKVYRLGVSGMGRGFSLMVPTFKLHPSIQIVAGADPSAMARTSFEVSFNQPSFETLEDMLHGVQLDAVYVASPHPFHVADVLTCLHHGVVVLCEKPMAIDLASATAMVEASAISKIPVLVGPSHSYDAPILKTAQLLAQRDFGAVKMLQMMNYTDFVYRPRRPEELDLTQGGGVVFSQAAHQLDIARLLCGGLVTQISARCADFDPTRSTIGAYQAQLDFANGAFASLTYSGYGHYDSDELCDHVSELGFTKAAIAAGSSRRQLAEQLAQNQDEAALKAMKTQQKIQQDFVLPTHHEHFGVIIVSCEKADIRPFPDRIRIDSDDGSQEILLAPPAIPRKEVVDELILAIEGQPILHDAKWSLATLECLLALNASAKDRQVHSLFQQVARPNDYLKENV